MTCKLCDDTGWVCEEHPGRPLASASKRADACDCCGIGRPCARCNPSGEIQGPHNVSAQLMVVANKGTRH
jgi:hypothetical protein